MKKILKNITVIFLVVIAAAIGNVVYKRQRRANFLSRLPGIIVFNRRDGERQNVYKISADGTTEKLVFSSDDKTNPNALSPVWSDDKKKIRFQAMNGGAWKTFVVNADGGETQIVDEAEKVFERKTNENLKIERGNLYVLEKDGGETLVYKFRAPLGYDHVFSPGAENASWSPDKNYIIFQSCAYSFCSLMIADRKGETVVELTDGTNPDWK